MHGFRDNEVLLQNGYDVTVNSPLGGVSLRLCWRNLKERPQFHNHGLLTHFAYTYRLPFATNFRVNTPKFQNFTFLIPKRVFLTPDRVFWAIVRENWITGMGCSSVEEYKNKKKLKQRSHSIRICCPHVSYRPLIGPKPTLSGLVTSTSLTQSLTPNVKSIDIKLCLWWNVEVSSFSTTTADAINTAKPCRAACEDDDNNNDNYSIN